MSTNIKKTRVAIAMSGGVDSSVAAMLLKKQGYDVVGFMMKLWYDPSCNIKDRENACCDEKSVNDARRVAEKLGIPFYVVDAREAFKKEVVDYFISEYKSLRTPNPCAKCNEKIKFGWLLDFAKKSGCDYLATGHYARIESKPQRSFANAQDDKRVAQDDKIYRLLKGKDPKKDQSYFLYNLTQDQLAHVLFPVGDFVKDEIRAMAKEAGLPVHEKKESQEICFIQEGDYREFLKRYIPEKYFEAGDIVDSRGYIIGEHNGLINYTIGQRKGINTHEIFGTPGADKSPMYVIGFNVERNQLVVGENEEIYKSEMTIKSEKIKAESLKNRELTVKIRYKAKEAECTIEKTPSDQDKYLVKFNEPQRAVTPGQSAVLYSGDEVVGGGIIQT